MSDGPARSSFSRSATWKSRSICAFAISMSALIDDRFSLRIGRGLVVVVQENVVGAGLAEIGGVEPLPGLDVDEQAPSGRLRLALDPQSLTRPDRHLGAREIEFEEAATRAWDAVGVAAEIVRVEEAVPLGRKPSFSPTSQ